MCIEQVDPRLLNRAGLARRALALWWRIHPDDRHPTNAQLAEQLRAVDGITMEPRTMIRAIADLAALDLVVVEVDRDHQVGRKIGPATPDKPVTPGRQDTGETPARVVTPDNPGAPELSPLTLNVIQGLDSKTSDVGGDRAVTPDKPVRGRPIEIGREDLRRSMGESFNGAMGQIMNRLALAIGQEQQGKLPLSGGDPQPRPRGTELRLAQVLGRLELPECDPADQQWAICRLKGEYGPGYEGFYRRVTEAVRTGREPIGTLIAAVEEAGREGVRNRGAAFVAACKRTMAGLSPGTPVSPGTPDPGPNRQAPPGSGDATVPDAIQPIKSAC